MYIYVYLCIYKMKLYMHYVHAGLSVINAFAYLNIFVHDDSWDILGQSEICCQYFLLNLIT